MATGRTRRRTTRMLAVGTALSVVASAASSLAPATADAAGTASCVPYQLPGIAGVGTGQIMTMNDAGTYVGGVFDASGNGRAAIWTHTGADLARGWSLRVPDLPVPNTEFLDVNASGVMSGFSYDLGEGFVYDSNTGAFTLLPDFAGGFQTWTRRINASGVVTGSGRDAAGTPFAAIWRPPYTRAERVHAPGETQNWTDENGVHSQYGSETDGINDQGTVTGGTAHGGRVSDASFWAKQHLWRNYWSPLTQAFTKADNGPVTQLPAGYDQAYGFAINNAGLVVGGSLRDRDHFVMPAYWRNGVEHDLGAPADALDGFAYDVSQGGWATGGIDLPDMTRSWVWTGAGSLQLDAPLPGYDRSWSHGVDDHLGQVGGDSDNTSTGDSVPTVWQCPAGFSTA